MTRWTGGASASLWPESLDSPWYYDDDDDDDIRDSKYEYLLH